ncbi:RnfABCDGE type electron transport complex subunit D, partial [Ruminococcaceae bacterium OttesenSCG-928-A16]|nr:RnfABCDGE type electron transport complex subunit D [Ruminococcaceae bacterium OttesenSCG-928-A16]
PEEIFRYPQPQIWLGGTEATAQNLWNLWTFKDVARVEGPSYILKNGGLPNIDTWNLLLGNYLGPLGVTACLVIVSCAVFLVLKKRLPLAAPITFLCTSVVLIFLFPRAPEGAWLISIFDNPLQRLETVKYEMLSSAYVFSAVFLVAEPGTLPKNRVSQCIYGFLIGVSTIVFRYFGTYELGVCFSILIVNAVSGYFDRTVAGALARRTARKAGKRKGAVQK